jgi:hypothetical protein
VDRAALVKIFWMILAGIGIVVAGFFLWRRDFDKAFVVAALGMVAWFLNYRAQMKGIVAAANLVDEHQEDEGENIETSNNYDSRDENAR